MSTPGHVSVMQGDLTQLAVDRVAIPASDDRWAREHWNRFVPGASFQSSAESRHVSAPARVDGIAVRYVESSADAQVGVDQDRRLDSDV